MPMREWAKFRVALGLSMPIRFVGSLTTSDDGMEFFYVLLTGREARLVQSSRSNLERLRFGSFGASTMKLQSALGLREVTSMVTFAPRHRLG